MDVVHSESQSHRGNSPSGGVALFAQLWEVCCRTALASVRICEKSTVSQSLRFISGLFLLKLGNKETSVLVLVHFKKCLILGSL